MELVPPLWEPRAIPLELPAGVAHVWRVRADIPAVEENRWRTLLAGPEQERLSRFHFAADARREAVGRAALRILLADYLDLPPGRIAFATESKGKPYVAGTTAGRRVEFNLSHSGEWVLLAFARGRRLGVDLERWREIEAEPILRDFFLPEEVDEWRQWPATERPAAFFSAWTLKEAYLKALGAGLSKPLRSFRVRIGPRGDPALTWCADDPLAPEKWSLARLEVAPGYGAALAVEKEIQRVESFTLPPR
jgi:4'-phosphopantetheinyl transferase